MAVVPSCPEKIHTGQIPSRFGSEVERSGANVGYLQIPGNNKELLLIDGKNAKQPPGMHKTL